MRVDQYHEIYRVPTLCGVSSKIVPTPDKGGAVGTVRGMGEKTKIASTSPTSMMNASAASSSSTVGMTAWWK